MSPAARRPVSSASHGEANNERGDYLFTLPLLWTRKARNEKSILRPQRLDLDLAAGRAIVWPAAMQFITSGLMLIHSTSGGQTAHYDERPARYYFRRALAERNFQFGVLSSRIVDIGDTTFLHTRRDRKEHRSVCGGGGGGGGDKRPSWPTSGSVRGSDFAQNLADWLCSSVSESRVARRPASAVAAAAVGGA